ncbi:fatty acid synthase-like [Leptopilina heterotoma]|uniref:fatty acid synthase-like n=1 Tax=Leptopilina heterotoma TaxID=63436 RepID=UPI001CA89727|nr:fatty acid synthase-like [Leptopilina heterotoma]
MISKLTGDEVVISGMSGKFPNCDNIDELQNNLLNKIDCITNSKARWDYEHPQVPPRIGIMNNVDKFDNAFFGVHGKLTNSMDPMIKIMIETSYEAIVDAGINPRELRGSKSAVFTASTFSESEKAFFYEKIQANGIGLLGASRAMLSNRVSFFLGFTGPSINIDSSCCGGMSALEQGIAALREGRAESAIIGASNVILHPSISFQLFQLGLLSPDGITKSFDNKANGYTRSEGLVVLFLQKARNAKRIYAEVKSVSNIFGNVNDNYSFFFPSHDFQSKNMKMTLKESGIKGKDISYVEADGSGIKDIDAEEVKAIDEVYNEGRNSPLLIGSIKSNIGSCSSVNPLNGIIKVITAMEKRYIPPNLNFKEPSDKIPAFKEGRCKVVTELTPWTGDYAVVNSLGLTGATSNVVLKKFKKDKKNGGKPDDKLSRLVIVSGCTEDAVDVLLSELEKRPTDVEMLQLLYDVFETEIPAHLYRGYTLLPPDGLVKDKIRGIQFNSGFKREIWYMFSGMGSQWVGMGEALLEISVFAEAIKKCDRVLKPRGIDIVRIITEKDPQMFDNIINAFVGIAAIQIGLVDVLDSVGLKPDFIIGHSVGELGCAYADGCFTAEQMVLAALSRGLTSVETELPRGSMAAVGLGYEEIKNLCPPDIDVACHNSSSSSTISGPEKSMKAFVKQLQEKNIFAKEVACGNIAYHSRYIAPAGEKLRKYLQEIVPNPKPRSNRWVSSSVPRDEWNSSKAHLSSAEYHTNNLLNSVLFAETAKSISPNAVVIEIAPQGLLQAIVKKSLPENVLNVPLTKRDHPENQLFLIAALGKIYNAGRNIKVSNLYPKVKYPVSGGTGSISSIIRWNHSANWFTNFFQQSDEIKAGEINFIINLKEDRWKYLAHAKIGDKVIIPSSLYLTLAWEVLNSLKNKSEEYVIYKTIKVYKHLVEIPKDQNIEIVTMVQKGSGNFEITNNEELLCSGIIQTTNNLNQEYSLVSKKTDKDDQDLSQSEIYTELHMRGFEYSGPFKTIRKSSVNGCNGVLEWQNNWTTFLEGMIQMNILGNDTRNAQVPITIRKVIINLKLQTEASNMSKEIPVTVFRALETVIAGGVQMEGIAHELILHETRKNNVITENLQISSHMDIDLKRNILLPGKISRTYMHTPIVSNVCLAENWIAAQMNSSDLESIKWVEGFAKRSEDAIKVEYSSVNQSDILSASTKTSSEDIRNNRLEIKSFGQEYSGINAQGKRVMGIVENAALSNYIASNIDFTWKLPENWSLEDAATVPLAYATAYLALIKGELKNNESIFIYDGTCSIGQAAINLVSNVTSQVFAGYTTNNDKKNLKDSFSNIPENHLISTSGTFPDQILAKTNGNGVNVVIYNGDDSSKIETCLMCAKNQGKIIILGNLRQAFSKSVGMQIFLREFVIFSIVTKKIINLDLATKKKLSQLIENGLLNRTVKPLPRCVYSRDLLKDAFIHGASKKVFGKILVKIQPEDGSNRAPSIHRFLCKSEASYLIIEGLSDFGLELVDFLVVRGAKSIVIASESKNTRSFSNHRISLWRSYGVVVTVREELDLTHRENGNALLEEVGTFGTVDAIFDLQRLDNSSRRSSNAKYLFTKHLFEESRQMCPNLRHFIIFSTSKVIGETVDDLLLREVELTKICQPNSKGVTGLLILLEPVSGIAKKTTEYQRSVPLLSIYSIIKQLDIVTGSNTSIASVYHKSEDDTEKVPKHFHDVKETEKSKFVKYINSAQSLTTFSRFQITDEN